ncbi:hypothetical protein ABXJ51_23540, partial [Enterobacter hormaechei]
AFDVVREWAENSGAYYPLLEYRRLTYIEDVRKSEDILNRLEFIDRRFREFISIMVTGSFKPSGLFPPALQK